MSIKGLIKIHEKTNQESYLNTSIPLLLIAKCKKKKVLKKLLNKREPKLEDLVTFQPI